MLIRSSKSLAPYLQCDRRLSPKANEILQREYRRMTSCGNLFHEHGFILEHNATGRIKDVGRIACKSRWCICCLIRKEIEQRERLEATIDGFVKEFDYAFVGLLTSNLPPLNEKLNLYDPESIDEYFVEADFRREVRDRFSEHLREAATCSFIRGWFRSEEQTISTEKYIKGEMVKGNNLNLHFHTALFMQSVPEELRGEYQMSCYLFVKWLRCYRQVCKRRGIKPKPLKEPYRDENGVIRGSVVFVFQKSMTDGEGKDWFSSYLIKKSAAWNLSAEAAAKNLKSESKGFNMQSIIESKRSLAFKENAVRMLVLVNHGQREFEYSKLKTGRVQQPKKTKKRRKSPEELMHELIDKYQKHDAAKKKAKVSSGKDKKPKTQSTKANSSTGDRKGLGCRYMNKMTKRIKEEENREWIPYAAVTRAEYYKEGEALLIRNDVTELFKRFEKESTEARNKGRKKRKRKVKFERGESLLAS